MAYLPQDPIILLSYVNTQLRDNYSSLDEMCKDMDIDRELIINKLLTVGYVYNPALNQFK
ncbi:MAG: DUF4250 domain-containing protein [Muribaculaceae bacterium]